MGNDSDFQKPITGSFIAAAQTVDLTSPNQTIEVIQLTGTWVGTLIVEGSNDNTTYYAVPAVENSTNLPVANITANGAFIAITNGYQYVRIRSSAWTSGTATITVYGSDAATLSRTLAVINGGTDGTVIGNDFGASSAGLRVASLLGNATGIADFAAGNSSAQTLRVVIATNQAAIPVSQSDTWTVQPGNTQNTTAWLTQDAADGPVTPGTVATKSILLGGQFNTTLPTLTNGQQAAIQIDSSGRLLTSTVPKEFISTNNSSTANLASAATFTGTSENVLGYVAVEINFKADQAVTIQYQQSTDNSNWDIIDTYTLAASTGDSRTFAANANYIRVLVTNNGGSTTTLLRLQTIISSIGDVLPRSLSTGGQLKVADSINTTGQNRAQSVTTSAAEALGAATILRDRKFISVTPTNGTVYWGFSNAVTTSSGTPIFKNTPAVFAFTDNVHIYLICASGTVDCRIAEGS